MSLVYECPHVELGIVPTHTAALQEVRHRVFDVQSVLHSFIHADITDTRLERRRRVPGARHAPELRDQPLHLRSRFLVRVDGSRVLLLTCA